MPNSMRFSLFLFSPIIHSWFSIQVKIPDQRKKSPDVTFLPFPLQEKRKKSLKLLV